MSKQKNPDKEKDTTPEVPKHLPKRKKKPKRRKEPPKEYSCPFCGLVFKVRKSIIRYWSEHPRNFKCAQCEAGVWGYYREVPDVALKWSRVKRAWVKMMGTREEWTPEYCPFCKTGAHHLSKEHRFAVWTNPQDDLYCDKCKFRGKVGGKRK
jgi:hypothetical protein